MQELQLFEWQLKQSPIMSVLFTPETVPLTTAPLAWPSKLSSRTYLPPSIASPQQLSNNANIPQKNLHQGYDTSESDEFFGVTNRQLKVPQAFVTPPNYLNMQLLIKNSLQQPSPVIQKKKPYISPSLRVNKIFQNADGIDVRMNKNSDEQPNQMISKNLDSLQIFDENNETEVLSSNRKVIQKNPEQKHKETAKRQFAVNVLYQKQNNDIETGKSNIAKENEFNEENSNVQLPIMNQVEEKHSQNNFQDMKTAPIETNDEKKNRKNGENGLIGQVSSLK